MVKLRIYLGKGRKCTGMWGLCLRERESERWTSSTPGRGQSEGHQEGGQEEAETEGPGALQKGQCVLDSGRALARHTSTSKRKALPWRDWQVAVHRCHQVGAGAWFPALESHQSSPACLTAVSVVLLHSVVLHLLTAESVLRLQDESLIVLSHLFSLLWHTVWSVVWCDWFWEILTYSSSSS